MVNPVRILVVDDEEDIREILQFNLENEGFLIDTAASGEEALQKISPAHHLIVLDVMMGGLSGYHVAEKLRKNNNQTPIIFLTAKRTENDLLTGFSVGADDYIAKPFSIKEVIARIKAILRRNPFTTAPVRDNSERIVIRDMTLDLISKQLEMSNQIVPLTKTEFDILSLLMRHPRKMFTREEILQTVWKNESYVLGRTVDVHVARLRKKLDKYGCYINNRTGYGYSFNDLMSVPPDEN
jgi:DNA-binding response OmpR family regulator